MYLLPGNFENTVLNYHGRQVHKGKYNKNMIAILY